MIRARLVKTAGNYTLIVSGHASGEVCAGAGMIMQAAALGLRDLAKQFPRQIAFDAYEEGHVNGGWTDKIDSEDNRKRK